MSDVLPFFRTWAAHPLRIASVVLSGRRWPIDNVRDKRRWWSSPGTWTWNGRFYAGACRAGQSELELVLVECTTRFAQILC